MFGKKPRKTWLVFGLKGPNQEYVKRKINVLVVRQYVSLPHKHV